MRINISKAFNLNEDDPEGWKKAAIFTAVYIACIFGSILILPALFLMLYSPGYMVSYTRNVATGDDNGRLPQPLGTGGLWHGFMTMLIGIVYSLPLLGVMAIGFGGAIVALIQGQRAESALASMGGLAGLGLMGLVACFLGLVIAVFMPMVMLQYCRRYQFADAFDFGAIISGIMRSPADYAMIIVVPAAVNMAVAMIPFVGLFLSPIVMVIGANLIGQYGAKVLDMQEGSIAAPVAEESGFSKF